MAINGYGRDMTFTRASLSALLLGYVATAAVAAPAVLEPSIDVAQLSEPAGRKGTRNYKADDLTATGPSSSTATKTDGLSFKDKLNQCMDTWDAGTHITKSKWREICKRQLEDQ